MLSLVMIMTTGVGESFAQQTLFGGKFLSCRQEQQQQQPKSASVLIGGSIFKLASSDLACLVGKELF